MPPAGRRLRPPSTTRASTTTTSRQTSATPPPRPPAERIARWQADRLATGAGRSPSARRSTCWQHPAARGRGRAHRGEPRAAGAQGATAAPRGGAAARAGDHRGDARARAHRDATLISVLAYAGLRPGEALALRWGDIRTQTMLVAAGAVARRRSRHEDPPASDRPAARAAARGPRGLAARAAAGTRSCSPATTARRGRFRRTSRGAAGPSTARSSRRHRADHAVRASSLLRLAAAPRGPQRYLRRAAARSRRPPDAHAVRPRDRRARRPAAT